MTENNLLPHTPEDAKSVNLNIKYTFGSTRRLLSAVRRAVDEYHMIGENDRICVGLSGGKDSLTLLTLLSSLRRFYPKKFELFAVHMDPAFYDAGFGTKEDAERSISALHDFCAQLDVPFHTERTHIAEIVFSVRREENPCSLCSRMRRGALHGAAKLLSCNKLALGHHFDDAVETLIMNLFNEGRIGCFSPVTYLDRRDITVIRPLLYCSEKSIRYFVSRSDLPLIESPCPADKDSERKRVKELLRRLEKEEYPGLKHRLFGAMQKADLDGFGIESKEDKNASESHDL